MEEANSCDNGAAEVWGWLAYVCMCSQERVKGLRRDREATAALEQALREVGVVPQSYTRPHAASITR